MDIIKSYSKNYYRIIFINKEYPIQFFKENFFIPMTLFNKVSNIVDLNVEYEEYIKDFNIEKMQFNNLAEIYTKVENSLLRGITIFTKYNVYILPYLIIGLLVIYIITRKKINNSYKKVLQLILTLYIINYGSIMAYVVFINLVDRYIIPTLPLTYIADVLLIIFIIKVFIEKIYKKFIKRDKIVKNKQ